MEYDSMTIKELKTYCKQHKIKGYFKKSKNEIIDILKTSKDNTILGIDNKKNRGQYYTTNSSYILEGFDIPDNIDCIIEPFAGKGDLIDWVKKVNDKIRIEAYDIQPMRDDVLYKDTLSEPPCYCNKWVLTNPPYLARNKSEVKEIYDIYNTNDLYKCFISSIVKQNNCYGGIFIIPAGFFFSPRDIDVRCRDSFMKKFKILKVKYFEETVFNDTTTTIVALSFQKSATELKEQYVDWIIMPHNIKKTFHMSSTNNWIIGGDIYNLKIPNKISIRRHVENQKIKDNENQTFMTLNALDTGTKDGRIKMIYKKNYIYPAKDCSRTYATIRISGIQLDENEQIQLCEQFNEFIEKRRNDYWSLFLPQYRESKEYARKRIPFELAYRILLHLIYLSLENLANQNNF